MSASILTVTGLADLVAPDRDAYVIMAAALAGDHGRLSQMHDTLRPMMEASPFCDGPRFARGLEAAYRGMWEAWCAGSA
jgi:predicted O-linked N-acetylglucosamine transferase (SPINDLY family)